MGACFIVQVPRRPRRQLGSDPERRESLPALLVILGECDVDEGVIPRRVSLREALTVCYDAT